MQRTIKVQIKRNSKRTSLSRELHTHVQQETQLTRQYRTWNGAYFECVLMTARHICKCAHVVCTLAWIIWPMPPPAPVDAAVHKKYSRFRDSAVDDASTFNWTQHTKTRSKLSHYSVLPLPYLTLPYPDLPSKA